MSSLPPSSTNLKGDLTLLGGSGSTIQPVGDFKAESGGESGLSSTESIPLVNIEGFRIIRLLGQGGMGRVYLAEQTSLRRMVALKLIRPEALAGETARLRFQTEAEAVARINHPGIVQIHSVGEHSDTPYMVLEYVSGRTLKDVISLRGTMGVRQALAILGQVARALERAHEVGVVHRDIKPDNILVTRQGQAKVTDFGLARLKTEGKDLHLTQEGIAIGTPLYMSPEQVGGKSVDIRSDIYSLGVTAYHMLAGHPPFQGKNAIEVALLHVHSEAKPLEAIRPDIPPAVAALVRHMMAQRPEDRPQNPRELLADITRATLGLPPQKDKQSRRRLLWARMVTAGLFFLSLLLTLALAAILWPQKNEIEKPTADPLVELGVDPTGDRRSTSVLRTAANEYVSGTLQGNPGPGMVLSIDLAVRYLNANQWEEAESFFRELESEKNEVSFQTLGKLGLAIVLALRNRSEESGAYFRSLKTPEYQRVMRQGLLRPLFDRGSSIIGSKKDTRANLARKTDQGTRFRYWLAEAVAYNRTNGRPDSDLPPYLKTLITDSSRPEK